MKGQNIPIDFFCMRREIGLVPIIGMLILNLVFCTGVFAATRGAQSTTLKGDWPTYLSIVQHSSYNGYETTITPSSSKKLKLQWQYTQAATISVQPIAAAGKIYWGSWDGIEHAMNLNGTQAWTANLGKTVNPACGGSLGVLSTGSVESETIGGKSTLVLFVGGGDGQFYALEASTGRQLWHTRLGPSPAAVIWSSPVVYNGSIYIGVSSFGDCGTNMPGELVRLNALTGAIQNIFHVVPSGCGGGSVWGSATVDPANGTLYFATGNGYPCSTFEKYSAALVELHTSDLSLVNSWQVPPAQQAIGDADFGSTPTLFQAAIGGNTHYLVGIGHKNGLYYAFNRANISKGPIWEDQVAQGGEGPEFGDGTISPTAWDNQTLYVAGGRTTIHGQACQGSLRAVNPATGAYIWEKCMTDGPVLAAVTVVPGVAAVGEGTRLMVVATANGSTLFEAQDHHSNSQYYGPASISQGMLYIGNKDGNLYAYGP